MEATCAQRSHLSTWIHTDKYAKNLNNISFRYPRDFNKGRQKLQLFLSDEPQPLKLWIRSHKVTHLEVSCSHENSPATSLQYGNLQAPGDEELILECSSDTLVEQDAARTSVADIFKLYGESYFRDKESEVLRNVSLMHILVVSAGGGTVMRPINWYSSAIDSSLVFRLVTSFIQLVNSDHLCLIRKHMHKGISIWLDVPVEALARRIAAVETNSRPLLHHESGDTYTKAFLLPSALFKERGESYANASARISLENIAAKLRNKDVSDLSPTVIAIEALEQIGAFLKGNNGHFPRF